MKASPRFSLPSREVSGVERQLGVVRVVRGWFTFLLQVCSPDLCE